MARFADVLTDQNLRPINGATVTVLTVAGTLASLTDDAGGALSNPFYTGITGAVVFNAVDGIYTVEYRYGGRLISSLEEIVGSPPEFKGDTGATGPANSTYTSLAAMKAAPVSNASYILTTANGPVTYAYVQGDFTGKADDVNVVQLNAVPLTTGALVRQTADSVTVANQFGNARRSAIHAYGQAVRLTQFGFRGDGVTDDTNAWRAGIAYAGANNIRDIIIPPGVSIVSGQIVNAANPLPPGLRFIAEGCGASAYSVPTCLRYTGSGTCFFINYPTGGFATVRGPSFDGITFQTTNPAATFFDFNDTLNHIPYDDAGIDPSLIIQQVEFTNCLAFGVAGTGDFIRACKTFEMYIDHQTAIYSFRRGVWLKGCDNNDIRARFAGNNRGVMIEFSGSFGNNNKYTARSIQAADTSFGGETSYAVWDSGSCTTIGEGILFESGAARAFIYINGFGGQIYAPQFASSLPCIEVGPSAREYSMHSPRTTTYNPAYAPIINDPISWNFGDGQLDYRLTVTDVTVNFRRILMAANTKGRIRIVGGAQHGYLVGDRYEAVVPTTYGLLQSVSASAANGGWWGVNGIGGQPLEGIVPDSAATGGYAVKMSSTAGSGFSLPIVIGASIQPAKYEFSIRNRLSPAGAVFVLIVTRNGSFLGTLPMNTSATYARSTPVTIDATTFAPGDILSIEMYNNGTGPTGWVDNVFLRPIPD